MAHKSERSNVHTNEFDVAGFNKNASGEELPHEYIYMPSGTNLGVQLFRKIGEVDGHKPPNTIKLDQMGHTLVVGDHTFGVKVYLKFERATRRLVVFLEDQDGRNVIGEYEK